MITIQMTSVQSIKNKKGEVDFRRKLAQQFLGKQSVYPGEPSGKEYSEIVKGRINDYTKYFNKLQEKNIPLSPYLEIGTGVGQGGMLLENKYNASGFITDISYETLAIADKYKKELQFKKMPIRIACDAYNLPFQTGSIPFIFTFQTLHHLPDPLPVLKEIKRVLAPGGYFYFAEEPVAQTFNLNLWRRDRNLQWYEKILKALIILHFISRIGKSEVEHNILEETFTIKTWQKALNIFPHVHAKLNIFPFGWPTTREKLKETNWLTPPFFQNILLQLLGGGIEARCQTDEIVNTKNSKILQLIDYLVCPQCLAKPKLFFNKNTQMFTCNTCKTKYKNNQGVYLLFSKDQLQKLYPEYA